MGRPLAGIRVADFGQLTAGANTSAMLADLGAEVIKIESPSHLDLFRRWKPDNSPQWWNESPQFHFTNRNKYGVAIDLKHSEGRALAMSLVQTCDVLIENYRRGVLTSLGLGYDAVTAVNPRLVYASISSQGEVGPYRLHRTYGSTLDAMGGLSALTGYHEGSPEISGMDFNYPDQVVSLFAAGAIMGCLREARRTGRGGHLDIAQREVVTFMLGEYVLAASLGAPAFVRRGNQDEDYLLQDTFQAADGRWIALTVGSTEETFLRQCIGATSGDLHSAIARWCKTHDADTAVAALAKQGIQVAAVNNGRDLLGAPALVGESLVWGENGRVVKGMPYVFDDMPFIMERSAPDLGEHNYKFLSDSRDMDELKYAALEREDVLRSNPKEHK
jgi:benzylsuccinate CoA-transferase BbsF subunit